METKAKLVKDLITSLGLSKEETLDVALFLLTEKQANLFDLTRLDDVVKQVSGLVDKMEEQGKYLIALMQDKLNSLDKNEPISEPSVKTRQKRVVKTKSAKNKKSEEEQVEPQKGYSKNGKKLGRPKRKSVVSDEQKEKESAPETVLAQTSTEEPAPETVLAQTSTEEPAPEIAPAQTSTEEPAPETVPAQTSTEEPAPETVPAQTSTEEPAPETVPAQTSTEEAVSTNLLPSPPAEIIVSEELLGGKVVENKEQKFLHKSAKKRAVLEQNRKETRPSKKDIESLAMGKVLRCKLLYQTKEGLHLSDRALNSLNPEGVQVPYRISGKFFILGLYDEAQGMTLKEATAYAKKLPRLNDRPWMVLTPQQKESCLAVKADLNEALKKVGGDLFDGGYLTNPPSYGKKGEKIRFAVEIEL